MAEAALLAPVAKFSDPDRTAKGERRARVALRALRTLWINTGSLCNITCRNCYIESSPENDRLAYITRAEVAAYLDEIARDAWPVGEIGFMGRSGGGFHWVHVAASDSRGNLYTGEVDTGKRVQRFVPVN